MLVQCCTDLDFCLEIASTFPKLLRDRDVFVHFGIFEFGKKTCKVLLENWMHHSAATVAEYAIAQGEAVLEYLSSIESPLLRDGTFLRELVDAEWDSFLQFIDSSVQRANPSLVVDILWSYEDTGPFLKHVDKSLLHDRDLVIPAIEATERLLVGYVDPTTFPGYRDDEDFVLLVAKYVPFCFCHASHRLLADRNLWFKAISLAPVLLPSLPPFLFSMELMFASARQDPGGLSILPGFLTEPEKFERLRMFADYARGRLVPNTAFLQFLRGWQSPSSGLSVLDQGPETSQFLAQRIASFLNLPRGDELADLRKLSALLAEWGL